MTHNSVIFKENTQRPLAADVARIFFFAACEAAGKAKKIYAAANKPTDANVCEFFAAYKAAGIFVSLTQCGNHNRRFEQVLT